ncbi:hypothetical protein NOCARDAX2BIS_140129 [Nocardioides sp. AX2bis]|nr:hypothetical protein NOCARDAX2BIS_140129 [Nocardioides sp. AX2bis]
MWRRSHRGPPRSRCPSVGEVGLEQRGQAVLVRGHKAGAVSDLKAAGEVGAMAGDGIGGERVVTTSA